VEPIPQSSIVWHIWNRQNIEGLDIFNKKNVDFSRKNIATLDGIELLSNLQSLDLGENEITSLQDLQFPTTLEQLDLHGNQLPKFQI
jgi:Leucine-rich repeat (LRR) protein